MVVWNFKHVQDQALTDQLVSIMAKNYMTQVDCLELQRISWLVSAIAYHLRKLHSAEHSPLYSSFLPFVTEHSPKITHCH
jgi:hypothetical protein